MPVGFAPATANSILNLIFRATAWTPPAGAWIQLHVGDPGAAGTANVANETDRVQGTFGTNASAGSIANTAAITWTGVSGTEDYTHFSVWGAVSAGTFYLSGTVTANAVVTGDNFTVGIGGLVASIPVAS